MKAHLLLLALLLSSAAALAEDIVVIVNPKNNVSALSRDDVINIFMGRNRLLSSGISAMPLDLPGTASEREAFYLRLTGKSMSEINAYWARLVFTGRASNPTMVRSQDEALQKVMENRSAVAYVNRSKANPHTRIVFELNEK